MLTLRRTQVQRLEETSHERFVERLRDHLRRFFPARCEELGDRSLRRLLSASLAAARAHGLRSERDLCKYCSVSLLYGAQLGSDASTRWMADYLEDPDVPDASERMERLLQEVVRRRTLEPGSPLHLPSPEASAHG